MAKPVQRAEIARRSAASLELDSGGGARRKATRRTHRVVVEPTVAETVITERHARAPHTDQRRRVAVAEIGRRRTEQPRHDGHSAPPSTNQIGLITRPHAPAELLTQVRPIAIECETHRVPAGSAGATITCGPLGAGGNWKKSATSAGEPCGRVGQEDYGLNDSGTSSTGSARNGRPAEGA